MEMSGISTPASSPRHHCADRLERGGRSLVFQLVRLREAQKSLLESSRLEQSRGLEEPCLSVLRVSGKNRVKDGERLFTAVRLHEDQGLAEQLDLLQPRERLGRVTRS